MDKWLDGIVISNATSSSEDHVVKFGWILRDPDGSSLEDFSEEQLSNLSKVFTRIAQKALTGGAHSVGFFPEDFDMLEVHFKDFEKYIKFLNDLDF